MNKIFPDYQLNQVTIADERFYERKKDIWYPSVTWICDTFPKGWAFAEWQKSLGFNADIILQRAGDEGTQIHDILKMVCSGASPEWFAPDGNQLFIPLVWECACKGVDFIKKHVKKIYATETKIFSDEKRYAGTIDLVCQIGDETWLVDWKSGNAIYDSQFLQVIAYMDAVNELHKQPEQIRIDRAGVLHLKATTRTEGKAGDIQGIGWKLHEVPNYEQYRKQWNNCLDTFYFIHREEIEAGKFLPKNKILPNILTLKTKENESTH